MSKKISNKEIEDWLKENLPHIKLIKLAENSKSKSTFIDLNKNVEFQYNFSVIKYKFYNKNITNFCPTKEEIRIKKIKTNFEKYGGYKSNNLTSKKQVEDWLKENLPHIKLIKWSGKSRVKSKFYDEIKKKDFDFVFTSMKYKFENNKQTEFHVPKKEYYKKAQKTYIKKYGVEHLNQSYEIRKKTKETNLKKYGVENPAQNEKIKQKTKETNIVKYGVENILQSKQIRKKIHLTRIKKGLTTLYKGKTARQWSEDPTLPSETTIGIAIKKGFDPSKLKFRRSFIETIIQIFLEEKLNLIKDKDFFCNKLLPEHVNLQRKKGKRFPDFLLPEYNLIIECDGEYWHPKGKKYKDKKRNRLYIDLGYNLLVFSGVQIQNRFDYVERQILKKIRNTCNER